MDDLKTVEHFNRAIMSLKEDHTALVGMSDEQLLRRAPTATHQHFKGGLYRLIGNVQDADTGDWLVGSDGHPRMLYEHVYPYPQAFWVRDWSEWYSRVDFNGEFGALERFRPLTDKKPT